MLPPSIAPYSGATIDAPGWIDWTGGPCPLQYGQKFRLKYRDGVASLVDRAADEVWMIPAAWEHMGTSSDIVAYRICG